MIEVIDLNPGVEQDVVVPYGERNILLKLRYNDFFDYWHVDISDDDTNENIITGIKLNPEINALASLGYLGLGLLGLYDTEPDSDVALDKRTDLGNRLKLFRDTSL